MKKEIRYFGCRAALPIDLEKAKPGDEVFVVTYGKEDSCSSLYVGYITNGCVVVEKENCQMFTYNKRNVYVPLATSTKYVNLYWNEYSDWVEIGGGLFDTHAEAVNGAAPMTGLRYLRTVDFEIYESEQ